MGASIIIPEDPAEFFERFLPQQFAKDCHRYRRNDSRGSALFEVIDRGAWGIRRVGDRLDVVRGRPDDIVLQIGVSSDDFKAIFVERTQREIDVAGDLSDDSRDVFKPLFVDPQTAGSIAGAVATLAFHLRYEGTARKLFITPGRFERTDPRSIISMQLRDFLAMVSGRKGFARLLFLGQLKIRGDLLYAQRMSRLLA